MYRRCALGPRRLFSASRGTGGAIGGRKVSSDRSAAIAEVPNPALAKEQMRAAIVRRSRKKASTQYHRPNAVGNAPRAIVDHFAPKGASGVSLERLMDGVAGRLDPSGRVSGALHHGQRAPGARGVEPERDQNKGDAGK